MKKKQKISADNGVSISYKVEANERIKIPFFNEIMLTLLSVIASVGAVMTFSTILNLRVMPSIVISSTVVFSAIYTVLYKLVKKKRLVVIAGAVLLAAVTAALFFGSFSKGVVILYDQARETISVFMGWDEPSATYVWEDGFVYLTNFVMVVLSGVLCSAISYFTHVKQSFIAVFLLTFPFFEVGAAFGAVPDYLYFSLMLGSWAAYLTVSRVSNAKIKMRRSNGKKQKKEIGGRGQRFAGVAVAIAVAVVLSFTAITTYLNAIDFTRSENIDALRRQTKYAFDDFIDLVSGVDNDGSLKEGKLYMVDDRVVKNRHYITMQTNIAEIEQPIKLKGYTAAVYKNNQWNQNENADDYSDMFRRFNDRSYMMGINTGRLISDYAINNELEVADFTMSDFRRKKPYAYEVYYADLSKGYTPIYDLSAEPQDRSQYTYTAYLSQQYIYKITQSALYQDDGYAAAFKEYSDFVKAQYTESEATDSVKKLASEFEADNMYDYINLVRSYLQDNIEHTTKSGKCPSNADFVENFLFNTKKGYSTHFATAAAVLMQAKGYPARYVEGYYISKKTFASSESANEYGFKTVDITDKYAHAWIEIFDETYGWIPVEVTPGYWSGKVSPPQSQSSSEDSQGEDGKESEDSVSLPENIITILPDSRPEEDLNIVEEEVRDKLGGWDESDTKTLVQIIISLIILMLIAVAAIYAAYLVRHAARKRLYASQDVNKKIKFAYRYLCLLVSRQNIKIGNVYNYTALAQYIGDKAYYITTDQVTYVFNVFLKHAYSCRPASLEEADEVIKTLREYSSAVYSDLSKYEKLVYKYLLNLL